MMAAFLYSCGIIGFLGGNIFYDSLLMAVAGPKKTDFVSALGFAFGYLGGGILLAFNVFMTKQPGLFGFAGSEEAIRVSFISVAIWWALFTIPLLLFVEEARERRQPLKSGIIASGFRQLLLTFAKVRKLKQVLIFLIGYWLYIDGVDTIVRMAVDYGLAIGFKTEGLVAALLITQFIGFPSAIAFGKIGEKLGPRTGVFIGIGVYILITVWAYFMRREIEFFVLAAGIGAR
jgi:UMF1 family MFS transporter